MIVVDSSAVVAILHKEPEAASFAATIRTAAPAIMSAVNGQKRGRCSAASLAFSVVMTKVQAFAQKQISFGAADFISDTDIDCHKYRAVPSDIGQRKKFHGTKMAQRNSCFIEPIQLFTLSTAAHNLKAAGSNPAPATKLSEMKSNT